MIMINDQISNQRTQPSIPSLLLVSVIIYFTLLDHTNKMAEGGRDAGEIADSLRKMAKIVNNLSARGKLGSLHT